MFKFSDNFNPGYIPRKPDPRDVPFRALLPLGAPAFNWNEPIDIRDFLNLIVEDQGTSGSCVGQAWSKLVEIIRKLVSNKPMNLSARGIYSYIFVPPDGGAWGYKGGSALRNRGVELETITPSYMNAKPPTEEFMRIQNNSTGATSDAGKRKITGYSVIDPNIDEMALAIKMNGAIVFGVAGSNVGWGTAYPIPPKENESLWGHFIVGCGAKIINGKKHLVFLNSWSESWGDGGFGYLSEDYFGAGRVYSGYNIQDIPEEYQTQIDMKLVMTLEGTKDQYLVSGGKKHLIPDLETRDFLVALEIIPSAPPEEVKKQAFDSFELDRPMPSVIADKANKEIYEFYKERLPLLADAYESNK